MPSADKKETNKRKKVSKVSEKQASKLFKLKQVFVIVYAKISELFFFAVDFQIRTIMKVFLEFEN